MAAAVMNEELRAEVLAQLAFYFSESNLRHDVFLQQQMQANGGGVPLRVVLKFKRMKKLGASFDDVVAWLGAEGEERGVTVDAEDGLLRPTAAAAAAVAGGDAEAAAEHDRAALERTVLVSRLPADSSVDSVRALFEPAGEVLRVAIKQAQCTGEVEFASPEAAGAAVDLRNEPDNWRSGLRVELKSGPAQAKRDKAAARRAKQRAQVGLSCAGRVTGVVVGADGERSGAVRADKLFSGTELPCVEVPESVQAGDRVFFVLGHDAETDTFHAERLEALPEATPTSADGPPPAPVRRWQGRRRSDPAGGGGGEGPAGVNGRAIEQPGYRQARGPDGTRGFGAGRGRPVE